MKSKWTIALLLAFAACDSQTEPLATTDPDLTGTSITYWLQSGSTHGITGVVSFFEKKDRSSVVEVTLSGVSPRDSEQYFPVHLHLGDIATELAEVAALLEPVCGATGKSKTELKVMADESPISFADLKGMEACIKVHQSETGPGRDIILVAGNIGGSYTKEIANGRTAIGLCKSE